MPDYPFLKVRKEGNMKPIKDRAHADLSRPYEKALYLGPEKMTDAELLAVILNTGAKGESAVDIAQRILNLSPNKEGLLGLWHLGIEDYKTIPGIGVVKAIRLVCISELSRRLSTLSALKTLDFSDSATVAAYYQEQLRHEEREKLIVAMLDTRCRFLGDTEISRGTVNASYASAREIFTAALRMRAVSIVLVHNHPSGDPSPSEADLIATRQIAEAGRLLGICVYDHIIIGDTIYASLREFGYMDEGVESF